MYQGTKHRVFQIRSDYDATDGSQIPNTQISNTMEYGVTDDVIEAARLNTCRNTRISNNSNGSIVVSNSSIPLYRASLALHWLSARHITMCWLPALNIALGWLPTSGSGS